jgi:predicted ATP-grasp superfamily ATP-dependent carboligase
MDELIKSVLDWWEDHQYDTIACGDGDEDNVYHEDPSFVVIAKKLAAERGILKAN